MGGGTWNRDYFEQRQTTRAAQGQDAFVYHRQMQNAEASERRCNPAMDLRLKPRRESRDSAEHPESIAITVMFDQTGSMEKVPRVLQQNLNKLMSALVRNGVNDPQVMIGAIGDGGMGETAPIQVGEWESDIRIDDSLGQLYLEGGGGGNRHESYELALYAMARHTSMDCWEKRQHKGYLFIIGDELPYEHLSRRTVKEYIGDKLEGDIRLEAIMAEVQKMFETYFLMPTGLGSYEQSFYRSVERRWKELLGAERMFMLRDPAQVSDRIAETVSQLEQAKSEGVVAPTRAEEDDGTERPKRRSRITKL